MLFWYSLGMQTPFAHPLHSLMTSAIRFLIESLMTLFSGRFWYTFARLFFLLAWCPYHIASLNHLITGSVLPFVQIWFGNRMSTGEWFVKWTRPDMVCQIWFDSEFDVMIPVRNRSECITCEQATAGNFWFLSTLSLIIYGVEHVQLSNEWCCAIGQTILSVLWRHTMM